ncbi:MAG: ABC transporter permease [Actinomycetales bacterium]|nr:ABC transporter permease [Actinomycetales bacterium]
MTPTLQTESPTPAVAPAVAGGGGTSRALRAARSIAAKAVGGLVVLWGAATAAFAAQLALPGDRATVILNVRAGQAMKRTPEELAGVIEQYGLDHPVILQYLTFLGGLARGDLGNSYQQYRPVWDVIGEQIGATFALTFTAIVLAWVLMVVWVTLTAGRRPQVRALGSLAETVTAGLPHYWLGIILMLVFALGLGWFPVIGGTGLHGLLLPALTLAIPLAGFMGQATRAAFETALTQPFVISARMRGMGDLAVRLRHVLRHAVLPAVTLSGWALGATVSGAVVVETIFTRPGIGKVLVTAVNAQDLPVVTGIVVVIAAAYVVANLLVDVAYTLIDPRLRTS